MAQQIINVGDLPNDGTGDPIRIAFTKVNENFSNLFAVTSTITTANTAGTAPNQTVFEFPVANFGQGTFVVKTSSNDQSQTINISAHLNSDNTDVIFVGSNTVFNGDPLNQYNMDVSGGNVRLQITPLVNAPLAVEISSLILPGA